MWWPAGAEGGLGGGSPGDPLGEGGQPPRMGAGAVPPVPHPHTPGGLTLELRTSSGPWPGGGAYLGARLSRVSTGTSITRVAPRPLRSEKDGSWHRRTLTASGADRQGDCSDPLPRVPPAPGSPHPPHPPHKAGPGKQDEGVRCTGPLPLSHCLSLPWGQCPAGGQEDSVALQGTRRRQ